MDYDNIKTWPRQIINHSNGPAAKLNQILDRIIHFDGKIEEMIDGLRR